MFIIFLLALTLFIGCSGSGSASDPIVLPSDMGTFEVTPSSHDFGMVTIGNSPASIEVALHNNSYMF